MDQIKRARFRCHHIPAVELAEREWAPAKGIAHCDQLTFAHDDQRERALNPAQCCQDVAAIVRWLREKMQNDFAVSGGLENRTSPFELIAQNVGVN